MLKYNELECSSRQRGVTYDYLCYGIKNYLSDFVVKKFLLYTLKSTLKNVTKQFTSFNLF